MSINFFILFIAWAANFQSGNTVDQTSQNELSMKQFGAYLQKKLVTEGKAVYDVLVDLFSDLICKNEECLAIKKEFLSQSRLMPYIHFDCAMKFVTVGATNLYDHVTGVAHVRVTTTDPWPDRIQRIIEESKHMYTGRDFEDDLTNYNKWLTYVTDNPLKLRIGKEENHDRPWRHDRERQWKFVATYLQGNLTNYYDNQ